MSDNTICYALRDGVGYLKLAGELRHTGCGALDALIEQLFQPQPRVRAMVIDLTAATFMDSTMIGLLASIARQLEQHDLPPATLFSTQPEINQLLASLCLDSLFTLVAQPTDRSLDPAYLPAIGEGPADTGAIILKAHEALLGLSESNRLAFTPVVELFREQAGCGGS